MNVIEENKYFVMEITRYSKFKYRILSSKGTFKVVLGISHNEFKNLIENKYNGMMDTTMPYGACRFNSEEDAKKVYDWINSIVVINKLKRM
jgi:hypothetical protein